ncbi:MAG: HK97 gp10 family phage protein [Opitutaceae bacterium]|nr:HK97 gp10 family phage protein [Opitutaceae bacterium]
MAESLRALTQPEVLDRPVEIAAWKVRTELIQRTPKRWTGNTRQNWQVKRISPGSWSVFNPSKIMRYLEDGTGHASGGWIYPVRAKALFVPLTQRASFGSWRDGLKYGVDYVLARRVRAIRPMKIVRNFQPIADVILRNEITAHINKLLRAS